MSAGAPLLQRLEPHALGNWLILAEVAPGHLIAARAGEQGLVSLRRASARLSAAHWRFLEAPGSPVVPPVIARSPGHAATPVVVGTSLEQLLRAPGGTPTEIAAFVARALLPAFDLAAAQLPEWSPDPARVVVDLRGELKLVIDLEQLAPGPHAVLFDPRLRWCTPEQLRGEPRDRGGAWYAAVILHDLIHGEPLFDEESVQGLVRLATVDSHQLALSHVEDARVATLIQRGLRPQPESRHGDRAAARQLAALAAETTRTDLLELADALFPEREAARELLDELAVLA